MKLKSVIYIRRFTCGKAVTLPPSRTHPGKFADTKLEILNFSYNNQPSGA
jgi:hypothetical protein